MKKYTIDSSGEMSPETRINAHVLFVTNNPPCLSEIFHNDIKFNYATTAEALNKIEGKEVTADAVVVDHEVNLSEMEALREVTAQNNLPLTLYTSYFDQKIKDMAMKLGADDYFHGPKSYLVASRIKFIVRLRAFRIKSVYRNARPRQRNAMSGARQFFQRRKANAFIVTVVVAITLLPIVLMMAFAREIETIKVHVFSGSRNACLAGRIISYFQLLVLIIYSPVFLIIKLPLKIRLRKGFEFSKAKKKAVFDSVFEQHKFKATLTHL
jgi:hypothetical protein